MPRSAKDKRKQIDPEKKPYELDSYTNVHELIDDIDCMLKINSQ